MENGSNRAIPRAVIAAVGAVAVASVLFRAWVEDMHGFGWEAARAVLDAVIDISLGVIVAALIIDRISYKFTMRSVAREGWSGFRLMIIAITDSLAELATGFVRQYDAGDYRMPITADETWSEIAGPPTREGALRLVRLERQVNGVKEKYAKIMHEVASAAHSPDQGESVVSQLENSSQGSGFARIPLQTIDNVAWHLAELWPRRRANLLEVNLELQRSARRWRRLSMSEPLDIPSGLVAHRHDIARNAVQLLGHAALLYIAVLQLSEDVRATGIRPGSDLDQLERMLDQVQKWQR